MKLFRRKQYEDNILYIISTKSTINIFFKIKEG